MMKYETNFEIQKDGQRQTSSGVDAVGAIRHDDGVYSSSTIKATARVAVSAGSTRA
jgi:hypothetical protein